ncbi:MAG TPA: transposase [Anaerolineales bacterium]|nr:transposase [Anaerolineales bacterium]
MTIDLLVVDSDRAFGELIRQSLEATGLYRVHAATTGDEGLALAEKHPLRLAIIEIGKLDVAAQDWLRSARQANPRMSVYAIPPSTGSLEPPELEVDGVFPKPFYLPDLPRLVSDAVGLPPEASRPLPFGPPQPSSERQSEPEPEWLSEPAQAQETLTLAVMPTPARAAALIRNDRLWALTIPPDSGLNRNQLAPLLSTASDVHTRGSLTRFYRPPGQKEDFVAYVTPVSRELALVVLFGRETPLGSARRSGENLVYTLRHPTELPPVLPQVAAAQPDPGFSPEEAAVLASVVDLASAPPPPRTPTAPLPPSPPVPIEAQPPRPVAPPTPRKPTAPLPPPPAPVEVQPPRPAVPPTPRKPSAPLSPPVAAAEPEPPTEPKAPAIDLPQDWVPAKAQLLTQEGWIDPTTSRPESEVIIPNDWAPSRPSLPAVDLLVAEQEAEPEVTGLPVSLPADWMPASPMHADSLPFLEAKPPAPPSAPAAPAPPPIRLPLSTVLIPRFPEHLLTPELSDRLRVWIGRLCLAWDWKPERIDIRPDRLEISLVLPPDEAPAHVVQELRDSLSERILRAFPELMTDLPSRRFWASAFLLQGGPAPAGMEVETFVREARRAQAGTATL